MSDLALAPVSSSDLSTDLAPVSSSPSSAPVSETTTAAHMPAGSFVSEKKLTVFLIYTDRSRSALNIPAMLAAVTSAAEMVDAQIREDQETLGPDVIRYFLNRPAMTGTSREHLIMSIYTQRITAPGFDASNDDACTALKKRLDAIVPEYLAAHPEMFHVGKGSGVSVRFIPGEYVTDAETGDILLNSKGNKVQKYRTDATEWARLSAVTAAHAAKKAAKATK